MQRSIHFQFWILNSLEFRINDVDKRMKRIEKILKAVNSEKVSVEKEEKISGVDKEKSETINN